MPIFRAHWASRDGAQCLQTHSRYGRVRPRAARQPFRPALSGSLSRRSSVVEHVIGNDGVSSSILLGGTMSPKGLQVLRADAAASWLTDFRRHHFTRDFNDEELDG